MRSVVAALTLLCFGCAERPNSQEQALISEVEKRVHLPTGAGELRCYKRYYTVVRGKHLQQMFDNTANLPFREMLIGMYRIPRPDEKPGIQWFSNPDDVPKIYDSGCGTLRVSYATGWPEKELTATCSFDISGTIPEEVREQPPAC